MATKTAMDTDMVNLNISRKVKNLYRELKNSEKRHRNSVVSRLYNTISWNSLTEKHPKLSQVTSRRKFSKTEANSRDVEKVSQCREQTSNKLKHLNQFIPYQHFKMKSLQCLQNILEKGDYMCQLDFKDAYFSVPLNPASRKFVWLLWSEKLLEFLCLYFGLGPAPRIFSVALPEHTNYNLLGQNVVDKPHNWKRSHTIWNILEKRDYMCKLDLKDAYFSVPLNPASRKCVQFLWSGKLYKFLCVTWTY